MLPKFNKVFEQRVAVDKKVDTPISPMTDKQVLTEFLSGRYCIQGVRVKPK